MASRIGIFFAELKRRKVYRVAVVYVVVGLGILGAAEVTLDPLGLEALRPYIVILVLLGFPIALVLAWAYEVKPEEPREAEQAPPLSIEAPEAEQLKSIVVLPFDNMSPDPNDAYFSDGLTEEIITHLSCCGLLRVISRNSAMVLKDTRKDTRAIGRELDVQCVLEGSVRRAGDDLRITAQLIDAGTDTHLWAETYEGTLQDVFDIQEKVARSIVDALHLELGPEEERRLTERPIDDVRAYECYLRARQDIYRLTKESLAQGIKTLQNGLDLLGDNALLLATMGEAYLLHHDAGFETDTAFLDRAEELAKRSLAIDPDLAHGKKLLGLLQRARGSLLEACRYMKEAHEADPNDAGILMYRGLFLGGYAGQSVVAEPILRKLLEIDPLSSFNYLVIGMGHHMQGEVGIALSHLRKSHEMNPEMPWNRFWIANALAADGQMDQALRELDESLESGLPEPIGSLSMFLRHALTGDVEGALEALDDETRTFAWSDPDFSYIMPGYFALMNLTDQAVEWLEHATDRGFINYPYLAETGPFLEDLRGDKRFQEMLEEVKAKWESFEV